MSQRGGAAIMVCGTTSGAGKSFLATALARWYSRRGLKVAPFKAQNMSNNARVAAGGEIGSAQYFQALAAGCVPEVRMNPVLLKPETDTRSQVILLGERNELLSAMEWRERSAQLWPVVRASLTALLAEYELVIIEGAGSPAEINLQSSDVVNMRVAEEAAASVLVVCDIDRGGAFAHLYGTYLLLPQPQRHLVRGFVLNRFRGDPRLLAPGPEMLQQLTGVPTLGVLPLWRGHGLPEEDGVFDAEPYGEDFTISILACPRISNLDEFTPLRRVPGISVQWARSAQSIAEADLLVLPGSKHVAHDLAWLRERRLDQPIGEHIRAGKPTLAVCGGLQMLGESILDPHGVEGEAQGLALLPYTTVLESRKRYQHGRYVFDSLTGYWGPLSGLAFQGYEIRHGATRPLRASAGALAPLAQALPQETGWQHGPVLALYTHGLFENAAVLRALFGAHTPTLEDTFDGLAEFVGSRLGARTLDALASSRPAQDRV